MGYMGVGSRGVLSEVRRAMFGGFGGRLLDKKYSMGNGVINM